MNKPPTRATHLEQAWAQVPHVQTHDSSKMSCVAGYAINRFDLGKLLVLPRDPLKPTI